jgi:hypothetical protein
LAAGGHFAQPFHDHRRQDVHAEKAQVASGSQAGDNQPLLRLRRRWFFQHGVDLVKPLPSGRQPSAGGAIKGSLLSCVACTAETEHDSALAASTNCCAQFFSARLT